MDSTGHVGGGEGSGPLDSPASYAAVHKIILMRSQVLQDFLQVLSQL